MYVCQTKLFTERVHSKRQKLYLKKWFQATVQHCKVCQMSDSFMLYKKESEKKKKVKIL